MKKSKSSITFKVLMGYLLLAAFAVVTVWFVYNKIVKLNNPTEPKGYNQKMALIGEAAARLYTTEGISRNIIQNKNTEALPSFHKSIDSISSIIDTLKTLYTDQSTKSELDSINQLLALKEGNLDELLELRQKNSSKNYYDRVLQRLQQADYLFEDDDYKRRLKNLKPYQRKVIIDYLTYAKKDNANRLTNRTADSLIKTMKKVLLSLEMKEHNYQQSLSQKENVLLANDVKISAQVRKIRAKIEQEEIQKSLARVQSTQETLDQTSKVMIVFGVSGVITILIFVILIVRDNKKRQRYRKELEEAKSYAEHLLKSREQIMATVTHDLRSPINSILGYSDLMGKTPLTPKQEIYLKQLKKSSDYTIRLVNDLLDFSKLEAGKIRIEKLPFHPDDLIKDTLAVTVPSPDPKKLTIQTFLGDELKNALISDPFRLRQILSNLIGNAYKFTEKGSITIKGEIEKAKDKTVLKIQVIDSGIGITREQQDRIFNEFSQAEASTEKRYGGSGLGLAITRKLAELLEGSITVRSEKGKGSTFILEIPVKQTDNPVGQEQETTTLRLKNADNQRVLIVDDDESQLNLTSEILRKQGVSIETATNGKEALQEIDRHKFDAVLTDIQMPNMDGFQFIEKLRLQKKAKSLPVIALSGQAEIPRETYLKKGFTDYLLKPFQANALLKILGTVLKLETEKEAIAAKKPKNKIRPRKNPSYDLSDLKTFTDGDGDSLKLILESFMENTAENLKILKASKDRNDWEKVTFTAHRMLPMLRQIKAQKTIPPLEKLERQNAVKTTKKELKVFVDKAIINGRDLLKKLRKEVK